MTEKGMVEVFTAADFTFGRAGSNATECAEYCNRLLAERGVRVYGAPNGDGMWNAAQRDERKYGLISSNFVNDTHTALLVGVTPIAKDTPEDVLRSVLAFEDKYCREGKPTPEWGAILSRMRKVLGAE